MKKPLIAAFALAVTALVQLTFAEPAQAQAQRLEPLSADETYRASGNEPFWGVLIRGDTIRFEHAGEIVATGTYADPVRVFDTTAYIGRIESREGAMLENYPTGLPLIVLVNDRPCSDSMAGTPYPNSVHVVVANDLFAGCGGDPVDVLASGPWNITHLMETPFTGEPPITMEFDRQGGVTGSGGCNRYGASYELDDGFRFGPVRSTRMACPGAIGENETRVFTAMRSVISIDFDQDGTLVLYSENGPVLRLSR